MKGRIIVILFLLAPISVFGQGEEMVTLDEAVKRTASDLSGQLPLGTKIVLDLHFSAFPRVSEYTIDELTALWVNTGNFIVVTRSELALIQKEKNFQYSGEVKESEQVAIGRALGAQTIISGSFEPFGKQWRMSIKAIEVETSRIQRLLSYTVKRDGALANLLSPESGTLRRRGPKTTDEKIETGALNILLGLGSYLDGDIAGGLALTAGYTAAAGLFIIEAAVLDWDDPGAGVPAGIGISLSGLTLVYGFVRPFLYDRSPKTAVLLDNVKVNIVSADDDSIRGKRSILQLAYSIKF
jgi:hypothetical protein